MPMLEGVDDEVTVVMTIFLMLMGVVVTWLFASFQHESQQDNETQTSQPGPNQRTNNNTGDETPAQQQQQQQQQEGPAGDTANDGDPVVTEPDGEAANDEHQDEAEIPEPQEGQIRVKIKYLDDRVRCVLAPANTEVGEFKRSHFARELAQDLLVRLIHNGRELQSQNTLEQYNIGDLSTVHCLVVPLNGQRAQAEAEAELTDLDLSHLMLPMFTLILALIWYCRILYRNFFNALSTLALVGITILYVFTLVMTWRNNHHEQEVSGRGRRRHDHQE